MAASVESQLTMVHPQGNQLTQLSLSVSNTQLNGNDTNNNTNLVNNNGENHNNVNINFNINNPRNDLPDILNSHLPPPPPYSTLPPMLPLLPPLSSLPLPPIAACVRAPPPPPPPPPPLPPGRPPLPSRRVPHASGNSPVVHCSRSGGVTNYLRPNCAVSETETSASKSCFTCNGVSIRWFIILIAFIGLLCAIIGTILGALRTTGREHLTLALLMIGVGIILITVSGIAWRLTSTGPSWRSILGIHELHQQQSLCNGGSLPESSSRRFVPRIPAPYGRGGTHHHPYGAMFYPEFQYRPPPPSYQASMQEYRLRLLLLDRTSHSQSTSLSPVSPPPTYRSSAASSLAGTLNRAISHANTIQRAPSRPPSYRATTNIPTTGVEQQQPSIATAVSCNNTPIVSSPSQAPCITSITSQALSSSLHDINRVTILQTTNTSQVCTPSGVNIVAISPGGIPTTAAATMTTNSQPSSVVTGNKLQILAHV